MGGWKEDRGKYLRLWAQARKGVAARRMDGWVSSEPAGPRNATREDVHHKQWESLSGRGALGRVGHGKKYRPCHIRRAAPAFDRCLQPG